MSDRVIVGVCGVMWRDALMCTHVHVSVCGAPSSSPVARVRPDHPCHPHLPTVEMHNYLPREHGPWIDFLQGELKDSQFYDMDGQILSNSMLVHMFNTRPIQTAGLQVRMNSKRGRQLTPDEALALRSVVWSRGDRPVVKAELVTPHFEHLLPRQYIQDYLAKSDFGRWVCSGDAANARSTRPPVITVQIS